MEEGWWQRPAGKRAEGAGLCEAAVGHAGEDRASSLLLELNSTSKHF